MQGKSKAQLSQRSFFAILLASVFVGQVVQVNAAGPVRPGAGKTAAAAKGAAAKSAAGKKPAQKTPAKPKKDPEEDEELVIEPVIPESAKKDPAYEELRQKMLGKIRFCDEKQLRSRCEHNCSVWTLEDKKMVTEALETACLLAPNLVKRAMMYSSITIYRCHDQMRRIGQAYPMYVDGRDNELMLADGFFENRIIPVFEKYYSNRVWSIIHELTHLADTGHKVSASKQWVKLLPKVFGGQTVSVRSTEATDELCWAMGIPSKYAGKNEREALAEYTTALVLVKNDPTMNAELTQYVKDHLLSADPQIDPSIESCYEGWALLNRNRSSADDIQKALDKFKKALEIDPNYTDADWGRQMAEMKLESALKKSNP